MSIPLALRRAVIRRAGSRCEYCRLAQAGQEAVFHIDHIEPVTAGGATDLANLALACVSCSLRKGARRSGKDALTGRVAAFFHPRRELWTDHFQWIGHRVIGLSPTGRATVEALRMNRQMAQAIRGEEALRGRHPPP